VGERTRTVSLDDVARMVIACAAHVERRFVVGIAGPPAAGKSTLAAALRERINARARCAEIVAMDGFHLPDDVLRGRGMRDVKGAPDTFDANGYVAALARLRDDPGPRRLPTYDRARHAPVPGGVVFDRTITIVLTEGNYLLLDRGGWAGVRPLLDLAWYLDADPSELTPRLVARHMAGGRSAAEARRKTTASDLPNACLVATTIAAADAVVTAAADPDHLRVRDHVGGRG
jgi:pantothenate kinase